MNQVEDLASYILRICKENDLSFNGIERRAKRKGYKISQGYISKIVSDAAANISVEKLVALAAGLNRPEEEVLAVILGRPFDAGKINDALMNTIVTKYSELSKRDKEQFTSLLQYLLQEIEKRLEK